MCFNFELCSQSINIVTNTHHCRSTKLKEMNCDVQSLAEKVPKYLPGQLVQSEQLIEEEPTIR